MKLKTLLKTMIDTRYAIKAFNDDGFYNDYVVDYLVDFNGIRGNIYSASSVLPIEILNGKVKFISYNHSSCMIEITVDF